MRGIVGGINLILIYTAVVVIMLIVALYLTFHIHYFFLDVYGWNRYMNVPQLLLPLTYEEVWDEEFVTDRLPPNCLAGQCRRTLPLLFGFSDRVLGGATRVDEDERWKAEIKEALPLTGYELTVAGIVLQGLDVRMITCELEGFELEPMEEYVLLSSTFPLPTANNQLYDLVVKIFQLKELRWQPC